MKYDINYYFALSILEFCNRNVKTKCPLYFINRRIHIFRHDLYGFPSTCMGLVVLGKTEVEDDACLKLSLSPAQSEYLEIQMLLDYCSHYII